MIIILQQNGAKTYLIVFRAIGERHGREALGLSSISMIRLGLGGFWGCSCFRNATNSESFSIICYDGRQVFIIENVAADLPFE